MSRRRTNPLLASMSERELQDDVVELARLFGWETYHTRDSRRSDRGYPDLTLAHPRRAAVLFVELKTETGRIRPEQEAWLTTLERATRGIEARVGVYLWRPRDRDLIERVLRDGPGREGRWSG